MTLKIERGQVWKNKKTGDPRFIIKAPRYDMSNDFVVHKGKRTAHTRLSGFLAKYEYSHESEVNL